MHSNRTAISMLAMYGTPLVGGGQKPAQPMTGSESDRGFDSRRFAHLTQTRNRIPATLASSRLSDRIEPLRTAPQAVVPSGSASGSDSVNGNGGGNGSDGPKDKDLLRLISNSQMTEIFNVVRSHIDECQFTGIKPELSAVDIFPAIHDFIDLTLELAHSKGLDFNIEDYLQNEQTGEFLIRLFETAVRFNWSPADLRGFLQCLWMISDDTMDMLPTKTYLQAEDIYSKLRTKLLSDSIRSLFTATTRVNPDLPFFNNQRVEKAISTSSPLETLRIYANLIDLLDAEDWTNYTIVEASDLRVLPYILYHIDDTLTVGWAKTDSRLGKIYMSRNRDAILEAMEVVRKRVHNLKAYFVPRQIA